MKTTQRLKQQVFKEIQSSGLFKEVQSKLKTEVLNLVEKQSNQNKKQIGFQYEHPLLPKLRKYPLTSLCMDLIQEFLQSFKFKYTLSVFRKEINRESHNMNRMELANNFNIEMKNPQSQAVLLSLVSQLVSGEIKVNPGKQNNAFAATNKNQSNPGQTRINNFINEPAKPAETASTNFTKKPTKTEEASDSSINDKSKLNNTSSLNNSASQQESSASSKNQSSSNNQSQQQSQTPQSSVIQPPKPAQSSVSEVKEQSQVKESKDDKKKGKKKKEVEKPPEGATDLMKELLGEFQTKDKKKAEEEEKKKKIFEEKRAYSEEKAKKVVDPSESGANKIRGVSMGKMSNFMSKFMPQQATTKNESYIEEDMDEFQQSRDSTRKNPLYSSSESGFDKSGYYDMSVDSNAINDFEYVEKAKKFTKKL